MPNLVLGSGNQECLLGTKTAFFDSGANFVPLAEQAVIENRSHIGYLEALLAMESEERDRHAIAHRLHDAKQPQMKTLEEFEFARAPQIPATKVRELAEGDCIARAEPVEAGGGQ